jgi:hypothetical protein
VKAVTTTPLIIQRREPKILSLIVNDFCKNCINFHRMAEIILLFAKYPHRAVIIRAMQVMPIQSDSTFREVILVEIHPAWYNHIN